MDYFKPQIAVNPNAPPNLQKKNLLANNYKFNQKLPQSMKGLEKI